MSIEKIDAGGRGVGRHPSSAEHDVKVAGAAPGDVLDVHVDAVSRHHPHVFAHTLDAVERGDAFRLPPCHHAAPVRGRCGGCAMMHLSAETQRAAKSERLTALLAPLDVGPIEVQRAPAQLGYRNKGQFVAFRTSSGQLRLGSRTPDKSALPFARMDGCLVLQAPLADVADAVRVAWLDEIDREAELRFVVVRANAEGRALVELIVRNPHRDLALYAKRIHRHPAIEGVSVSLNTSEGNAIRGEERRTYAGSETLAMRIGGVHYRVGTAPFVQLNHAVNERMIERLVALAGTPSSVWDLYGGIGSLGLAIGQAHGAQVVLAESNPAAVAVARDAAKRGRLKLRAHVMDLEQRLPEGEAPDVLIVDPPRKGLSDAVLGHVERLARPLLYMSCGPESFARDVTRLRGSGWRVSALEAHDMLPQTPHVEILSRIDPPGLSP